ncbi:MAG TPA: ribonuclease J [Miltoncostaeaceae bacterium]|nr:ribonuclease J [Miltoncostaeaceae bacterium]
MGDGQGLRIIPLGGAGEIGKNMYVYELDRRLVIVDCGVKFPTPEQLGVDLVLPDFSYVAERREDVDAVILTHGHEDHIGALPYLVKAIGAVPIYATRFTRGLLRGKLDEHRLREVEVNEIAPGDRVQAGPFEAEFVRVAHSIPDCVAVALRSRVGLVVHTGDFKFDQAPIDDAPTDISALARLGDEGVLALLSDSTNAEVPGSIAPERTIGPELRKVMATAPERVIVTTFASHIHRMQQVLEAAHHDGRVVGMVGRSMLRNTNIAMNLGLLRPPDGVLVSLRELEDYPRDEQVILSTGSQGEPGSALRRIAHGDHHQVHMEPGDTVVFSARAVPGNELSVNETINRLSRAGARVLTQENANVHVSGHAASEELRLMLRLLRPRFFAPVHGEFRHQRAHADLARTVGVDPRRTFILANGEVLEVAEEEATVVERVETGLVYVDGLGVADVADGVLRDRRHLAEDGLVLVVATLSARDGSPIGDVDVITRGFGADDGELIEETRMEVERSLAVSAADSVTEVDLLQRQLHDTVAALLYRRTRARPLVLPVIVEA